MPISFVYVQTYLNTSIFKNILCFKVMLFPSLLTPSFEINLESLIFYDRIWDGLNLDWISPVKIEIILQICDSLRIMNIQQNLIPSLECNSLSTVYRQLINVIICMLM